MNNEQSATITGFNASAEPEVLEPEIESEDQPLTEDQQTTVMHVLGCTRNEAKDRFPTFKTFKDYRASN